MTDRCDCCRQHAGVLQIMNRVDRASALPEEPSYNPQRFPVMTMPAMVALKQRNSSRMIHVGMHRRQVITEKTTRELPVLSARRHG
jgi:hypothetical protein